MLAIAGCVGLLGVLAPPSSDGRGRQTATTFKNIKVFEGLNDEQIDDAMMYMRASLGVQCEHCHDDKDWSLDTKEEKRTARQMIRMVREINRQLGDDLAVSCYTCHRGRARPTTAPTLLTERPVLVSTPVKPTPATNAVTADVVARRYLEATGGDAWSRLTTRVMKGRLVTSEPATYPAEVFYRAPDKFRSRILVNGEPYLKVFDGTRGWNADNRGSHDALAGEQERLRRQAAFALPMALKTFYPTLAVDGEAIIRSEPTIVLSAPGKGSERDRLFFSASSGLLLRIESATVSPLGALPRRWDYEDYRRVNGVRLPFKFRETDPDYTYLWEFTDVRQNVPVDEAMFRR
jgi:hypothetical protein